MKLHNKPTLVREGPSYPRNSTPIGVSLLALAHLVMKHAIQVKASILSVRYDAMPPYGGYAVNGLNCYTSLYKHDAKIKVKSVHKEMFTVSTKVTFCGSHNKWPNDFKRSGYVQYTIADPL